MDEPDSDALERYNKLPEPLKLTRNLSCWGSDPTGWVVVEDYADTVIYDAELVWGWAPVLRRTIALDDGRPVFAAEGGLELA